MNFEPINEENLPILRAFKAQDPLEISDFSESYTRFWRSDYYHVDVGLAPDYALLRATLGHRQYFVPVGKLSPSTPLHGQTYLTDSPISGCLCREIPGCADYIYSAQGLAELKGSKFQQKRNHIHRFEELGPWHTGPVNVPDCLQVLNEWLSNHPVDEELVTEVETLRQILSTSTPLHGLTLYSNSKPVGFALGERLSPTMILESFEKALPDVQGAFPMVTREFARLALKEGYTLINRAGADGHPNLVKAKESWHPIERRAKYWCTPSRAQFTTGACQGSGHSCPRASEAQDIINLWSLVFGDAPAAIEYFLSQKLTDDNCLIIYEEGKLVAAGFFLEQPDDTRYVYALMTHPDYRHRGYATELIRAAQAIYAEPLTLVAEPAPSGTRTLLSAESEAQNLLSFYENLGFRISHPAHERTIELDDFAREFYKLDGVAGPVTCNAPTLTWPLLPGYEVPLPLN